MRMPATPPTSAGAIAAAAISPAAASRPWGSPCLGDEPFTLTFAAKFWRVYKSGVFMLRGEIAVESWSSGTAGRDVTSAAPLILPGATFLETNVEMQIVGVTIFWIIRNNNLMRGSYVPGLDYPRRPQLYGVRWVFTN